MQYGTKPNKIFKNGSNVKKKTKYVQKMFDKIWILCFWPKSEPYFFALKMPFFGSQIKNKNQNEECHTSSCSLLNFQSIGILTWKFFIFAIFRKKSAKTGQKLNFPLNDGDR